MELERILTPQTKKLLKGAAYTNLPQLMSLISNNKSDPDPRIALDLANKPGVRGERTKVRAAFGVEHSVVASADYVYVILRPRAYWN